MGMKLVVIGAGMASGRAMEHLLEENNELYDITLFGAEPRGNYNRIMLSPVLSGEKTYEEIVTHDADWYRANGVDCRFGELVTGIDRWKKVVITAKGETRYDKLLIATGSNPFIIPVPGRELEGVMAYRDLGDVNRMLDYAGRPDPAAVVIGGGLLGLEAAAGLAARGVKVTVVHIMPHLMERQLDQSAGFLLQRELERRGITILCNADTKEITGKDGHVTAVELADGTRIAADIVIMAVGIRPNFGLAQASGLKYNRGLLVNDEMKTEDPEVFAIGECVEHQGICYGLVAPLYDMAKVAARNLLGFKEVFEPVEISTKLKVTGCDLFSAGDFAEKPGREEIVYRDATRGIYKRLVIEDNRIIGAVMYGDTADGGWFLQKMRDKEDIAAIRDTLIFGPNFAGGLPQDPMAAVAALPLDAEICGCNGVRKGTIIAAIDAGAGTLELVKARTKASTSCGTCAGLVEKVVALKLGAAFKPIAAGMCKCTDLTHDEVRKLIRVKAMKSIPEVMHELEWKSSHGCASCRPALNYYMICEWPGEYQDHGPSRFINERVHANIQKDGTYSVVPRMWGGITNPKELRAIADVADKFNVPTVKVTGGQRIDLLGIRKEDLPAVWADLNAAGMVSGAAYAKGLRTVKTCVGTDHCRFGTQDSTGLGIKIERALWGAWSPHKFKMAVSGCPRNCAEATCKDMGVVCVSEGYQLHVGGAAGMDVKQTELLCIVATEAEAVEYCAAFYQLYRENAQYLHRPYKWIAKVGLDWVKEKVVLDAGSRTALAARFYYSQKFYQIDPWEERTRGKDAHEFAPLADLTSVAAE